MSNESPSIVTVQLYRIDDPDVSFGRSIAAFERKVKGTYPRHDVVVGYDIAIDLVDWALTSIQNRTMEFEFTIRRGQYVRRNAIYFAVWRGLDDQTITLESWDLYLGGENWDKQREAVGGTLFHLTSLEQLLREYGYGMRFIDGVAPAPVIERTPNTVTIDGETYVRQVEHREGE